MGTRLIFGLVACLAGPGLLQAQINYTRDAVEELQSLSVRADVAGAGDNGRSARLLEEVIRQELRRADVLYELSDPRADDCCVLRLDVRLATGAGRARFGVGFVMNLELGYRDQFGRVPAWTVIWQGPSRSNIVERAELDEALRFAARELAGQFVDIYRERFPRR